MAESAADRFTPFSWLDRAAAGRTCYKLAGRMPLPPFPAIELVEVEDLTPPEGHGFLRLGRKRYRARFPDGELSEPFVYDHIDRVALDAVVVVAHHRNGGGERMVYLRSSLRPPPRMRAPHQRPLPEKPTLGFLWEVVAGLVEPDECDEAGLVRSARRELAEEMGFEVEASCVLRLGPSTFPCPGVIGERQHFFH